MRLLSRMAIAFAATVALPGLLWAQDNPVQIESDNTSFGGSSAEFLLFGAGARGMALGGAFSTIVDDVTSMHYNPAGLTFMDGPEAILTVMPYFADTHGCGICIAVCPWSRPGVAPKLAEKMTRRLGQTALAGESSE